MRTKTVPAMVTAAFLLWAPFAAAQEYATVRDVEGKAFVQATDENEPQPLTINTPLTDGDVIWTNPGGRVGLMLKDGNRIWLDESSRLEAEQFPGTDAADDKTLRVRLWKGTVLLEVASWIGRTDDFLVATPSSMVAAREEGLFLVQIETVDRTRVTSLRGRCKVTSGSDAVDVDLGQTTFAEYGYAPNAPASADLALSPPLVEYRNVCSRSRQGVPSGGQSKQYLSPDLYAYAPDLDQNGTWADEEGYGDVWVPNGMPADWTPYSDGYWTYADADWGMTWVPYEPWGWVPFHYGNWFLSAALGWAWYPGSVFAPAWCSWYWGADYMGWCPLSPWNYPLWGDCGWHSCGYGDIYNHNTPYVHHREAPPPNPSYPEPHGEPGTLNRRSGEPGVTTRDGGPGVKGRNGEPGANSRNGQSGTLNRRSGEPGVTTRNGQPGATRTTRGPAVSPRDVRAYSRGQLSSDNLRVRATEYPVRSGSSSAARRPTSGRETPGTSPRANGSRNSGQGSSGNLSRGENPRGGLRSAPGSSDQPTRRGTDSPSDLRSPSRTPSNPRHSWSPSPSGPTGDSTSRSEGSAPGRSRGMDSGSSRWRSNPRNNSQASPQDSYGLRSDRQAPRSYSGRDYGSRPRSGQEGYSQPRSRSYGDRNYGSQPRQGGGYNAPSTPRSGQAPNRANPSRPSPRGGYSTSPRGGNSSGRSYSAPKSAPHSGSSGRAPSQSRGSGSSNSGSRGSGSHSSGSHSGSGGHRR